MLRSLLICSLLLLSSAVQTADDSGKFALKGAGVLSCTVYLAEREKRSNVYYLIAGWIEGFISAHNKYAEQTYDVLPFESLELLLLVIENHCKAHPGDPLYPILNSMIAKIESSRLHSVSNKIEITVGEHRTMLYVETLQRIQRALTGLGFYASAADGRFNDATMGALKAFQSSIGFKSTGFPDQTTLWRLLRDRS